MSPTDESTGFVPIRIAVLTVSDSRDISEDRSGEVLVNRLEAAGHVLADRMIVRDEARPDRRSAAANGSPRTRWMW